MVSVLSKPVLFLKKNMSGSIPDLKRDPVDQCYTSSEEILDISELVDARSFIRMWSGILSTDELTLQDCPSFPLQSIPSSSQVLPKEILEELFLVTNPYETLFPADVQPGVNPQLSEIPENFKSTLETIKRTTAHVEEKITDRHYANASNRILQYSFKADEALSHRIATSSFINDGKDKSKKSGNGKISKPVLERMRFPEVLITVVYKRPNRSCGVTGDYVMRGHSSIKINVLGSTLLTELRDCIKCPKDFEIPGDFSDNPDSVKDARRARGIFPSGLFFIQDYFYVDDRSAKFLDYSVPIKEWLVKRGTKRVYETMSMQNITISDLRIKLGQPYVYVHQGDCEHVLQFTDMRMVTEEDCPFKAAYPLHVTQVTLPFTICNTCQIQPVAWMVTDSALSPEDPAHYCESCFKMLHYSAEGNKLFEFHAYRYTDNDYFAA